MQIFLLPALKTANFYQKLNVDPISKSYINILSVLICFNQTSGAYFFLSGLPKKIQFIYKKISQKNLF